MINEEFFKDINYKDYQLKLINRFLKIYKKPLKDKIILEIGSDLNLNVAKMFVKLGVKKVVCINPRFNKNSTAPFSNIEIHKGYGEKTTFQDESFDIIFGIALLEHVLRVEELIKETKRLLKKDGFAFLQGNPLYTCHWGHHIWIEDKDFTCKFSENTNPFKPWEHLFLKGEDAIRKNLEFKNIPQKQIDKIVAYMLSDDISKIKGSDILKEAKKVKGINIYPVFQRAIYQRNDFYKKARKIYTKKDLEFQELVLMIESKNILKLIKFEFFEILRKIKSKIRNTIKAVVNFCDTI